MDSLFTRFTDAEVRDMLAGAALTDANIAGLGLTSRQAVQSCGNPCNSSIGGPCPDIRTKIVVAPL